MPTRRFLMSARAYLALACLTPIFAFATPLFEATYKGEYSNLNITMIRALTKEGDNYNLTSSAKSFMAKIDESSHFSLSKNTLRPNSYLYQRKIFGVKKSEQLTFDWQALSATYLKGGDKEGAQPLSLDTLDPTLYQLQLQRELAQNPTQKTFDYTFVRRNQTKHYHFERQANADITFKGKPYSAVVLARTGDGQKETKLWLIPELNHALAKIQHKEEDGDTYQVLLTDYTNTNAFKRFLQADPVRQ